MRPFARSLLGFAACVFVAGVASRASDAPEVVLVPHNTDVAAPVTTSLAERVATQDTISAQPGREHRARIRNRSSIADDLPAGEQSEHRTHSLGHQRYHPAAHTPHLVTDVLASRWYSSKRHNKIHMGAIGRLALTNSHPPNSPYATLRAAIRRRSPLQDFDLQVSYTNCCRHAHCWAVHCGVQGRCHRCSSSSRRVSPRAKIHLTSDGLQCTPCTPASRASARTIC